jgi:hypothetical protein
MNKEKSNSGENTSVAAGGAGENEQGDNFRIQFSVELQISWF